LRSGLSHVIITFRDILKSFLAPRDTRGPEATRRLKKMNKYELAVVLSAKLEDEERAATIEKIKDYITRYNGTVTNVDEWGKRKLAYEIQKMREAFYYFIKFESDNVCPNEVESHVRIMEPVIRYLCVKDEGQSENQKDTEQNDKDQKDAGI